MGSTILLTGFGPFPGAPHNPTGALIEKIVRAYGRPRGDVKIVTYVFPTSYAAVDEHLPRLIAQHSPLGILMFGLASRTPHLRIETIARNARAATADADRVRPLLGALAEGAPDIMPLTAPSSRLLLAARRSKVPVRLSRDAGRYLCNYLCWRGAEAAARPGGPRLVSFVHVPLVRPSVTARSRRLAPDDLARAGTAILTAFVAAARRSLPNVNLAQT